MSEVLVLDVPAQPAGGHGRRASVVRADRPVVVPDLPDLGQTILPDPAPTTSAPVLPVEAGTGDEAFLAGHAQGLSAGRAEGLAELEAERAAAMQARVAAEQLVASLADAVEEVRRERAVVLDGIATELAEAALALAAAVIGREPTTAAESLARGLALAPAKTPVVARMHPEDLASVDVAAHPSVTLQADPSVERGGCVLDLPDATIDAQLGPALERARLSLLGDAEVAW